MEKNLEKPLGIIDALYGGFELVLKRPWVLLIPIAVDLFLWMGPRVTAVSIFQQFIAWVASVPPPNSPPEMVQGFEAAKTSWIAFGNKFNAFSVVSLIALAVMRMPTLMGIDVPSASFLRSQPTGITVVDGATLTEIIALLIIAGVLVGSLYLEALARGVRGEKGGAGIFITRAFRSYISVGALIVAACIVSVLIMLPFALSATLVGLFDTSIGMFLLMLGMMMLMWVGLYLSFAVPAIFVSGANLWQAVVSSVTVFRYNFWSAIGLISLVYLIDTGFQIIWQSLFVSAWGALGADVANAFLGSALIGALMLFYYDRITWLNRIREQIRQQRPTP